jgi:prevent-host-death family protein
MQVNMHEAKTHLSGLVDEVSTGKEIVIARAGRPVARLVPLATSVEPRRPGLLAGRIRMVADFDDTPEWLIDAFEGNDETEPA